MPGCRVELERATVAKSWRGFSFRVAYPRVYPGELPAEVSGHVLLDVGSARVTPNVAREAPPPREA